MNAEEIIRFIHDAEKKTPVKAYVKSASPIHFPNCKVFGGADCVVFGEWADIEPVLKANADRISDLVYDATGMRSTLVRFPGGSSNTISRRYKKGIMSTLTKEVPKRGYVYFDWNVDSGDASAVLVSAEKIVRNSTAAIGKKNQIILLMHDAAAKTTTVEALPGVIEAYRDAGYRFDVLSEDSYRWRHHVQN